MKKKRVKWTATQTEILRKRYARLSIKSMQILLPDKTRQQIKEKVKTLRLKRDPAILKRERASFLHSIASLGGHAIVRKYGYAHLRKIAKKGSSGRQQAREKGSAYFRDIANKRWHPPAKPERTGYQPLPLHDQIRQPKPLPDWWDNWGKTL